MTTTKNTVEIRRAGQCAAALYEEEFPGEPIDSEWLSTAFEYDSAGQDWPDDSYEIYRASAMTTIHDPNRTATDELILLDVADQVRRVGWHTLIGE